VDGTRDRPPGRTAENWSRKDGIRAGSVSGPWRSGPRKDEAPRKTDHGTPPREFAGQPYVHGSSEPPRGRHATLYGAANVQVRGQGAAMMALWIAFGAMAAIAAVILALVFRPELAPGAGEVAADVAGIAEPAPAEPEAPAPAEPEAGTPAVPEATAPVVAGPGAGGAAQQADRDPALAGVSDVRLRVGPEFPEERRQAIVAALEAAGIAEVQLEQLPFRIATSRVGYYRAEDLPLAEALVRLVAPVLEGDVGVRDYGRLLSDAEPGRLDLWVGG
jgi:hypothetical protein